MAKKKLSWKKLIGSEDEQLKDITIIISSVEDNGVPVQAKDSGAYAVNRVYHYDLEGSVDEFIEAIEKLKQKKGYNGYPPHEYLIEGGQMKH